MKNLVIGGVPEHFNLPWLDTLARRDPLTSGFRWLAQPQGTGAMVEALGTGELDAALLLTEGAVAAVAAGAALEIAASYVDSPLQWGIHVPAHSNIVTEAGIRGARYAISRRGSGSHLMAVAHARAQGWPVDALEFVVVATLDGAVAAFETNRADVFFWERFMTAPLVQAGRFRRVGVFHAPWPAFVLCIARHLAAAPRARLMALFDAVLQSAQAFAGDPSTSARRVAEAFGIAPDDALTWLSETRWAQRTALDVGGLTRAGEVLRDAGLIEAIPQF